MLRFQTEAIAMTIHLTLFADQRAVKEVAGVELTPGSVVVSITRPLSLFADTSCQRHFATWYLFSTSCDRSLVRIEVGQIGVNAIADFRRSGKVHQVL